MHVAIDIGSTVVKIAELGSDGELMRQTFHPRDFEAGISAQVGVLLDALPPSVHLHVCSSANGGLRVGIVGLTPHFSSAVYRNQALAAGANPMYVRVYDEPGGDLRPVDVLLIGGGVDGGDPGPLAARLDRFDAGAYRFGALMYAGNRALADRVRERFPQAVIVGNPLANELRGRDQSVSRALRRAYLDDLVHKEGVSELGERLSRAIRPTPEVVNCGFHRVVSGRSTIDAAGPTILIDIGGATTDIHYTVEIVRDDSETLAPAGSSVARYVFTDLGIVASRDTASLQVRGHPRTFEFLSKVLSEDVREVYGLLREGEYEPSPQLLAYACLFLCLDRFAHGGSDGLPTADLGRLGQIILTGGGAQVLDENVVRRVVRLFVADGRSDPIVVIDRGYRIWAEGVTWTTALP